MLTRRSRKEGTSPNNVPPKTSKSPSSKTTKLPTPKTTKSPTPKTKKLPTPRPRSKSRSVDRKIRTRSRSVNKNLNVEPKVILVRLEKSEEKLKKEIKSNYLTSKYVNHYLFLLICNQLTLIGKNLTEPSTPTKTIFLRSAKTTETEERRSSPFVDSINNVTVSIILYTKLIKLNI